MLRASLVYGLVILSACMGMLTSMFVHKSPRKRGIGRSDGGGMLLTMIVLDLTGARWRAWSRLSTLGLSSSVAVIGWGVFSALSFVISWDVFRKTWRPLYRNRFRYWMLSILLLLFGTGLFILLDYPYCILGVIASHSRGQRARSALCSPTGCPICPALCGSSCGSSR